MAASLAAVFFAAQVFACCYSTARMARALVSLLSAPAATQAHACCARSASPAPAAPEKTACGKGCCLQDGSGRAPQLASVPSDLPAPLEVPAAFAAEVTYALPPARGEAPVADTGPPLYLKTLRLLV